MKKENYDKIKLLVEKGYSIEGACKALSINRNTYYYQTTAEQKNELRKIKMSSSKKLTPDMNLRSDDEFMDV